MVFGRPIPVFSRRDVDELSTSASSPRLCTPSLSIYRKSDSPEVTLLLYCGFLGLTLTLQTRRVEVPSSDGQGAYFSRNGDEYNFSQLPTNQIANPSEGRPKPLLKQRRSCGPRDGISTT